MTKTLKYSDDGILFKFCYKSLYAIELYVLKVYIRAEQGQICRAIINFHARILRSMIEITKYNAAQNPRLRITCVFQINKHNVSRWVPTIEKYLSVSHLGF